MHGCADSWVALVEAMDADRDAIRHRIAQRLRDELPAYGRLDPADLLETGHAPFAVLMAALRAGRAPAPEPVKAAFRTSGAQRAHLGVPVTEVLQTMRIAMEEVRSAAERLVPDGPDRDRHLLRLADLVLAWRDEGTVELARGHRDAELESIRDQAGRRAALVEALLVGGLPPAGLRAQVEALGLDPDGAYHVVRARPAGSREAATLLRVPEGEGLVAWLQGDACGVLATVPSGLPFPLGTAGPVALPAAPAAFRLAGRALETVVALGLVGGHDLAALGLTPAVLADPDVGALLEARYVTPLARRGPAGEAVLDTVAAYLAADCRLGRTAAELFLHANTVRYRLSRFEDATGARLRSPQSLAEVWWALERRRLTPPGD